MSGWYWKGTEYGLICASARDAVEKGFDFKEEGGQNVYFDEINNGIDSTNSTAWVRGYCGSMVKVSGEALYWWSCWTLRSTAGCERIGRVPVGVDFSPSTILISDLKNDVTVSLDKRFLELVYGHVFFTLGLILLFQLSKWQKRTSPATLHLLQRLRQTHPQSSAEVADV